MSIRQQLIDAIESRLRQIAPGKVFTLPGGPYSCSSSIKDVCPWRKVPFSLNQVPAIAFWDTDAGVTPGPSTQHEHKLKIELEGHVAGGTPADTARVIMNDVIACIGSDPKWSNLARWTDIDSHEISVEQSGDTIAGIMINFTITYRTPLWRI